MSSIETNSYSKQKYKNLNFNCILLFHFVPPLCRTCEHVRAHVSVKCEQCCSNCLACSVSHRNFTWGNAWSATQTAWNACSDTQTACFVLSCKSCSAIQTVCKISSAALNAMQEVQCYSNCLLRSLTRCCAQKFYVISGMAVVFYSTACSCSDIRNA